MTTAHSNAFAVRIITSDLPSWVPPPGQFGAFTLNTGADVGMHASVLANWCGGVFNPDFGPRGAAMYYGGGEHYPWDDTLQSGVFCLDCETRLWVRRAHPTAEHTGVAYPAGGSPTDEWGAYLDYGSPQTKHTYGCLEWMPAAWGGGPQGSLVAVGKSGGPMLTGEPGLSATWRFDVSRDDHTAADPSIFRLTGDRLYDFGHGPATINDAPNAGIDHLREGWWVKPRTGTPDPGSVFSFTSKTGEITNFASPSFWPEPWSKVHHFADDDILCSLSDTSGDHEPPVWAIRLWHVPTGAAGRWETVTLERPAGDPAYGEDPASWLKLGTMRPHYSEQYQCFYGFDTRSQGGSPSSCRVWRIVPPPRGERFTRAWMASVETVVSADGSTFDVRADRGSANDSYGKLMECPSLKSLVWTKNPEEPAVLIRPSWMI
jgi:hypothetical protein